MIVAKVIIIVIAGSGNLVGHCYCGKREFGWLLKLREAGFGDGINGCARQPFRTLPFSRFPSPELQKAELFSANMS